MATWEVVLEGRQGVDDMLNVLHYQDNAGGAVDWDAVGLVFKAQIETFIQPMCGADVSWLGITRREDIPGGIGAFFPFSTGTVVGTNADDDQMRQASILVRKLANGSVNPVRGWLFQGGVSVNALTGVSRWVASVVADTLSFWEAVRVISLPGGVELQMVIKARNPAAPNTNPYNPVASLQATNVPRTVRTRRESVGS